MQTLQSVVGTEITLSPLHREEIKHNKEQISDEIVELFMSVSRRFHNHELTKEQFEIEWENIRKTYITK